MNRAPPIHRMFSVARSLSATIPSDWLRKLTYRLSPCVTRTRSSGVSTPLTMASAAGPARYVPYRLQLMAFPEPQGMCATGMLASALRASGLPASPLKISCGSPSPEHATTVS